MEELTMRPVAVIHTDYGGKFGIPRQSGLVPETVGRVVLEPDFRSREAVRGLEGFSHIWLIWAFSGNAGSGWSPTVRPPRLGGNQRMGVFATRSPFRPNPIGLSCVKLDGIDYTPEQGPVLRVLGADLMDGTPILDIKPYVPYADAHPEALEGFARGAPAARLDVSFPENVQSPLAADKLEALRAVLAADPRPAYQDDPDRVYGLTFAGRDVRFRVSGGALAVLDIINAKDKENNDTGGQQ
jgi:tRNA-Thr(GGU) m(6)t(6)A37 methyltransferase TsaA